MPLVLKEMSSVPRGDSDGIPDWTPLTAEDAVLCLNRDVRDEELTGLFPGSCFFGRLVGNGVPDEMRTALSVMRTTLGIHKLLSGGSELIDEDDSVALAHAERVERMVSDEGAVLLRRGEGYEELDEIANPSRQSSIHIYSCEVPLPPRYAKWLKPRLETVNALGGVILAQEVFFLNLLHKMSFDDNGRLVVDVFGVWSQLSDWDEWLKEYERRIPADVALSGIELVAGLLHLADVLATLHLASAVPQVSYGRCKSASADDSLTDLWFMCYDPADTRGLVAGACEVCGELFVSTKKKTRGHADCMNRRRVMRSRAKKYAIRVEGGMSPDEAAKESDISVSTAREMLKRDQYKFRKGVSY